MKYTTPRLVKSDPKDWYVYFSYLNPKTGKKKPYKTRGNLNNLTGKARTELGNAMVAQITDDLKGGYVPPGIEDTDQDIKDKNRKNFYWWFQEKMNAEKAKPESFYNWRKLQTVYKKITALYPTLLVSDIDYKFLKDLEGKLLKAGDSVNYVADTMDRISSIVKIILKSGDIPYHLNPFNSYKIKTVKNEKKRISIESINKLEEKILTNPDDELARDMYLFSFYVGGMRFGDICRVKKSWFKGDYTEYTMNKAKNKRRIKIVPKLARIIDKYKDQPGEYLFNTRVNWDNELKSINARNVYFNKHLKNACKAAEITEITFHTSRHSFADFAKSSDIDIHTLKDLLGHAKVTTTEIYMKNFYKEETDKAMDKLFGDKK